MRAALADPVAPPDLVAVRGRHVAIVTVGDSCPELGGPQLAGILRRWSGTALPRELERVAEDRPDAVVLVADCAAPEGMAALRRIRREVATARLVVVARDDRCARQALNAGAEAFVPAGEIAEALAPALDAVLAGLVCAPRAARRLVAKPTFSHREKEILGLLVAGLTNRQIGARLYLAESTVKSHLASAFAKLGVRSRKDAVSLLLDPDERLAATALPTDATAS